MTVLLIFTKGANSSGADGTLLMYSVNHIWDEWIYKWTLNNWSRTNIVCVSSSFTSFFFLNSRDLLIEVFVMTWWLDLGCVGAKKAHGHLVYEVQIGLKIQYVIQKDISRPAILSQFQKYIK